MRELPSETPGDNPNGVKKLDRFASEMDTRRDESFSREAEGTISRGISLDALRRPIWDYQRLLIVLTLLFCLVGGGLLFRRTFFPQRGRIYHVPHTMSSDWTDKDAEKAFGSPGKLVYGSPGSPIGYAMEWSGKGAYCLIRFDSSGRGVGMSFHGGSTTIIEELAAFFGLPEP